MNNYLDYILYQNFINHEDTERAELSHVISESAMPLLWKIDGAAPWESVQVKAIPGEPIEMIATGTLPIAGWYFDSVTKEMLQHLKWVDMYKAQGKRYPQPRRCRSKARMSKEWRDRA